MANTQKFAPRLSKNNIDLSQILSDINNLPPAGTEDISAELNTLSNAVDAHLKMMNRKVAENNGEGGYVWRKYKIVTGTINITQITAATAVPAILQLSSNEIDFTKINFNNLAGLTSAYGPSDNPTKWILEFVNTNQVKLDNNLYNMTWNAETAQMSINANFGVSNTFAPVTTTINEYECFVIGTSESDYPNDGELNGYWYKRDAEELTIEHGEITLTSRNKTVTFNHNLGVVPRVAMIFPLKNITFYNYEQLSELSLISAFGSGNTGWNIRYPANSGGVTASISTTATVRNITELSATFTASTDFGYAVGTYMWIVVA